ncbi:binding protein [Tasmannia lanceolata]|uniref:binding protein n=1 Tax=Tasmannia lanceolata TaxID=3420 RepID=UPI0040639FF8
MEEPVSRIISELETHTQNPHQPISESSLQDLQTLFSNQTDPEDLNLLWEELSSKTLSHSTLVNSITSSIDSPIPSLSLLASHIYLLILLSPTSPIYTLFNPISFQFLLRSLRRSFKQNPTSSPPRASEKNKNKKRKGNLKKNSRKTHDEDEEENKRRKGGLKKNSRETHDEEEEVDGDLDEESNRGTQIDVKILFSILKNLESVLGRIRLDGFPDSLKSLVETVSEIPVIAVESIQNVANYNRLCDMCFCILKGVLKPEHGDLTISTGEVLKSLTPAVLQMKSPVRNSVLKFVTDQIIDLAKECDAVRKAVVYLPRFLVSKAPEKSDHRAMVVDSIMKVVGAMEFDDQIGFADYVVKMSGGKARFRLMAVDLITMLLISLPNPLGLDFGSGIGGEGENWWGLRCLEAIIQRCSDVTGGIRARALSNLAQVVGFLSDDVNNQAQLMEVMGFGNVNVKGGLNELLRKRCMDEKAAVRKAALHLIMKSTALLGSTVDESMLKTLGIACSDPLVSIRKAGLLALSELLRKFPDGRVVTEWLHAVPRLITDNESSIQAECENLFKELVLDHVSRSGCLSSFNITSSHFSLDTFETELESVLPKGVLVLLKGICDGEVAPCVRKICASLGKKQQLKPAIATSLQNIIRTSESLWLSHSMPIEKWTAPPGAWFLLSEVSSFMPKVVGWKFLHHHWKLLDNTKSESEVRSPLVQEEMGGRVDCSESNSIAWAGDRVFLLQTISNVSVELPPEPAAELAHNLLTRIGEFNMHPTEVDAHVKALRTLCKRKAMTSKEGDDLVSVWVHQLVSKALRILNNHVFEVPETSKNNSFLTPPQSGSRKGKREATIYESLSQAVNAVFTVGSMVLVYPSADVKDIVPLLHTIITSGGSEPKPKELSGLTLPIKKVGPSLYVQSWLTMGKICLADDKLAKRYIPLFVQELGRSDFAALRNNIVQLIADFCVRYTALVDCYIPKITNSLCDPCEVVRRQTFILLSRLLQRDYVKWRGVLFLRFLLSLVDESEKIRQLADFLFGNILKAKAPLLAYNSFVEAIFVLNDCHAHAGHSESHASKTGRQFFSIRGTDEKSRSKRMHIYVALLKQMAPEHLLATSAKLCAEILAAASDGLLNIDDVTGQSVLQDALQILACKEMRIQSNRGAAAADVTEMDEEGGDGGGGLTAARGRVVSHVAKKNLIQNAVPIFIELKRLLESKNSPLTGSLMECLRVLLKDFKNEFDEILVADKQLQKELIYDMQKYEAAKAKSTVKEAVGTKQTSANYSSPPPHGVGGGSSGTRLGSGASVHHRLAKLGTADRIASAVADAAAAATVRSVLKEVNRGTPTPPLQSMGLPKLKSSTGNVSRSDRPLEVLESLRRRQSFDSDDEN